MEWISDPQSWVAFATLLCLEVVLGVDNIVFISILAAKLPEAQQPKARWTGLILALLTRIGLLFSLSMVMKLTSPLFAVFGNEISGRDLILILGGLFLLGKATHEIHAKIEGADGPASRRTAPTFASVITQILLLDVIFSLDSVITAVGMVDDISIMICAVVASAVFMMLCAGPISRFVDRRPTVKMLALAFLLLIGFVLVAEGWGQHVSKGYIYFAMGFAFFVEMLNQRLRKPGSTLDTPEG